MSRNLVICLDGTDNEFCATNTNVVRLFQSLRHDPDRQVAYYDPGVGTIWEPGTLSKISQKVQMILGLAFGLGVTSNVASAYAFLMTEYEPGDRLYIFGFSRGALEARALAALIHRCGLLQEQLGPLMPYAVQLFQKPGNFTVVDGFRDTFSRKVDIEFLGLWDTVTSMGNVWSPVTWPNTSRNPSVRRVAHAIAIDERRAFFRQNRWTTLPTQTVAEAWFSGVHSDVGGGYDAAPGRLWAITLDWIVRHATAAPGLDIDADAFQRLLRPPGTADTPDCLTEQHDSLTAAWKPLELVPRRHHTKMPDGSYSEKWMIPALQAGFKGRPRGLRAGEQVHRSAIERFAKLPAYRPDTLVRAGLTQEAASRFVDGPDEYWTVPAPAGDAHH